MMTIVGVLAGLLLLTPGLAHATLQAAVSLDGGASLLACDQNVCAGGAVPTFLDTNPTLGILATDAVVLGLVTASFAVQTSVSGTVNTLSSGGTVIQNTDVVAHTLRLTIGDTDFLGPADAFTATGSGTWVDLTLPSLYGGSTITMAWGNDPANAQGAEFAGDTPGLLLATAMDTPIDGVPNQSFGSGAAFNVSGFVNDPADFSMTLDNTLILGPGIRLESRGQALSKPLIVAVPMPSAAWLVMLGGMLMLRRRSTHRNDDNGEDFLTIARKAGSV
jgi:hypothetical protein